MPLTNYGLLTGTLIAHGDQHGGNPHYLLTVQAGSRTYRVSVNLQSTLGNDFPPELQYQIIPNLRKGRAKAKALADSIQNHNRFVLAHGEEEASQTIDYVRDGFLDMEQFETLPQGTPPNKNAFYTTLVASAQKALEDPNTFIAAFGTGSGGMGSSSPARDSFGFAGIDNVHLNQGTHYQVGHHLDHHYSENGSSQDGAVLFFFSDGTVQGFFSKFQSQDIHTDASGNPIHTNVPALNAVAPPVARVLTAGVAKRKLRASTMLETIKRESAKRAALAAPTLTAAKKSAKKPKKPKPPAPTPTSGPGPGLSPVGGFVFADPPDVADPMHPFQPDDDSNVDQNFVNQFAKSGVPEAVPGPRGGQYPTMTLESVIGTPKNTAIQNAGQIVFHMVGDTGSPTAKKLPNETSVGDLMLQDFKGPVSGQPAFYFHLGDVVYYFGEQNYYYDQFYNVYREYPRPIFAIPGNHDGITYSITMQSLAPFISAFVDSAPNHWVGAAGISRTTMTQPGVYFTLDAPFVSIIGLYSNCSESYGYLDQQQTLFLYNELVRLKPLRDAGKIAAVLLAVHHPPMSYSVAKPSSQGLRNDIDKACEQASFWPDAIFSGHAHVYQRMTRTVNADGTNRDIPHLVCGAGGYNITPSQEVDKADMQLQDVSDPQFRLHRFLAHYGYMKLTLTPKAGSKNGTLRIEFFSPAINSGTTAADACVLDLAAHALL